MNKNIITGLSAVAVGIMWSYQSYNLPKASIGNQWAPIYFPLGLGILMTLFGLTLVIMGLNQHRSKCFEKTEKKKITFTYTTKLIGYTTVISIIYALLFEPLGYVLSTIFFMGAILSAVNDVKQWRMNLIISVSFSLTIYILFSKLLGIILPPIPFLEF